MSQTPEIRIRLQYQAMKRSRFAYEYGKGRLFLSLARQWKRPVQEIKRIVRGEACESRSVTTGEPT